MSSSDIRYNEFWRLGSKILFCGPMDWRPISKDWQPRQHKAFSINPKWEAAWEEILLLARQMLEE